MHINANTSSGCQAYLLELLGRMPSPQELLTFERNQDLLVITKRKAENDTFLITFTNATGIHLVKDGIVKGGAIQLHSQQEGHRFYALLFEDYGLAEEHYLMLDAAVKTTSIGDSSITLIQGVQLITIQDLLINYSPTLYNLD